MADKVAIYGSPQTGALEDSLPCWLLSICHSPRSSSHQRKHTRPCWIIHGQMWRSRSHVSTHSTLLSSSISLQSCKLQPRVFVGSGRAITAQPNLNQHQVQSSRVNLVSAVDFWGTRKVVEATISHKLLEGHTGYNLPGSRQIR